MTSKQGRQLLSFEFWTAVQWYFVCLCSGCVFCMSLSDNLQRIGRTVLGQAGWRMGRSWEYEPSFETTCWLAKRCSLSFTGAIPCLAACILSVHCLSGCVSFAAVWATLRMMWLFVRHDVAVHTRGLMLTDSSVRPPYWIQTTVCAVGGRRKESCR